MHGSFSLFSGKTSIRRLPLISTESLLKFFIEKKLLKSDLKFQLKHIDGSEVKTSDRKIHNLSITKLGKRKKRNMSEPIETVIIRAQQVVVGGLNPIQIEINVDRIINILKKYKNFVYKIILLGLLFPATIKNDTAQVLILAKKLNGVKKCRLNYKTFDIIGAIDLNKIPNWNEIKGQSVWTNIQFKNHKEINQISHLCFPFIKKSFNDLTSLIFSFKMIQIKKIEFESNEKKVSIFNFQIDIFLP